MTIRVITTKLEFEGQITEQRVVMEGDEPEPWGEDAALRVVGQPTPRVDGRERVSGAATYTADVAPPGMLVARFLRSPHPHARVLRVDAARAEALPGVRAVFHAGNAPGISGDATPGALFRVEVCYVGDDVALIVATSAAIADAARELVTVEYEPLPFVVDPERALRPDAPRVHSQAADNLIPAGDEPWPRVYQRGDFARGLAEADATVEARFESPAALHNALETHGAVADWDGSVLTLWCSTQGIYNARTSVANALGLPHNRVRVIEQYMGGGFGAKIGGGVTAIAAAWAARALGQPVRCMLDRHEENIAAGQRNTTAQEYHLGAKADGTLTAVSVRMVAGMGARAGWMAGVAGVAKELYQCANVRSEEYGVRTNLGTFAAFRAPGAMEGTAGYEVALDQLARKLGMDPLELRRKNFAARNQVMGTDYAAKTLLEAYAIGAERIGWATRDDPARRFPLGASGPLRRGVGMASQLWGGDGGPPAQAIVKLLPDGSAVVVTGTQDIGTGTRTVLAQIVAEELTVPIEQVRVELGDTELGVFSPASAGSMTLASVGPAARMAAVEVKKQLLEIAAQLSEAPADALELRDGALFARDTGREMGGIGTFMGQLDGHELVGKGMRGPNAEDVTVRTFGAQFAEVEVDVGTGEVRARKIVAVHDIGRVVNPLTLSSQFEGGIIQGLGFALTEERVVDERLGVVVNANLEGYKVPTIRDVPEIEVRFINRAQVKANTLGSLGAGEPPIIPTAGAIANAVAHALGRPVAALPLTPRRVLEMLAQEESR
ncbi:MAG TPA: xanthine dehydrogenase family protein molybdopterin-binding subunit [Ktedonobacterales bacterium]